MAEREPNRFNEKPVNWNNIIKSSESEDSEESEETTRPVRIRQKTARYVDEVSPQQVLKYRAIKRKKIQRRTSQLDEFKREDKAAKRRQTELDLEEGQTQPTKRVRSASEVASRPTTSS